MHETAIASDLLNMVEKAALERNALRILRVHVRVGRYAGVEKILLEDAFHRLKDGLARDAQLEIQSEELKIRCLRCDIEFSPSEFTMICPECGSNKTEAVAGQDIFLTNFEIAVD